MSSDDLLRRAARELRQRSDGNADAGGHTRERVLALTARRRRRRKSWATVVVLLACVLMMSSVWAAATGRLPRLWRALVSHQSQAPLVHAPTVAREQSLERPSLTDPGPAPAATTIVAPPPKRSLPAPRLAPPSTAPSPLAVLPDSEEQLFKSAYRDQFVKHDVQSALDGWDAYLRAAPRGRFALEAAYDRALCLVRLARHTEAIAALKPFAEGAHGDYHQRDAARLIAALSEAAL
jgi:hypothetical protein